jgi:glycosyltransferase involved in cell wall biosynthesis
VRVAYLTTYYNGQVDGRFGRFHDWVHTLRDMADPPFEFDVVALTASNHDATLSSRPHGILGEATDLWGSPLNNVEFALNLPRAVGDLRKLDHDVVHVLTADAFAYPVALLMSGRSPVVGPDIQGYFPGREGDRWNQGGLAGLKQRLTFRRRRRLLSVARKPTVIALSEYHAANIRKLDPALAPTVIPPGVDRIFHPGPDADVGAADVDRPTRFLYVGDFTEYKGFDVFLGALAQLPVDFEATAVGAGDVDRERIDHLGLGTHLSVEGFVPRHELPSLYRDADFLVMPSVDENGPNTIVEALATGTPVVATDTLGINEYAPEGAAIYADRSQSGFRKAMVEAHEHRASYVRTALEHADEFTAERTLERLAEIYRDHAERT